MKRTYLICALCSLLVLKSALAEDDPECVFWKQLAYNLTQASEQNGGTVRVACDSTCASITCGGHFKAPAIVEASYEFDFCFGLRLNQCVNPASMDYYLSVPDINISKAGSISHNDSLDIPGPKVMGADSTIVIVVEMVRVNASIILFGINGNLRLTYGSLSTFPVQEKVFPPTYIDILPCDQKPKTETPFTTPTKCTVQPTKKPPITTAKPVGTTKVPVIHSKTYNQLCEFGVNICGDNEMCQINKKSKSGICVCDPESKFDIKTGLCAPTSFTTLKPTGKPAGSPSVTEGSKSIKKHGVNMTAVIIGAVFGGLLLIVVIVSVIIFLGRRRRQADYRGRHQLLSDQDDDAATNVVI